MQLIAYYKQNMSYILVFQAEDGSFHQLVNMFRPSFKKGYGIPEWSQQQAENIILGNHSAKELSC